MRRRGGNSSLKHAKGNSRVRRSWLANYIRAKSNHRHESRIPWCKLGCVHTKHKSRACDVHDHLDVRQITRRALLNYGVDRARDGERDCVPWRITCSVCCDGEGGCMRTQRAAEEEEESPESHRSPARAPLHQGRELCLQR